MSIKTTILLLLLIIPTAYAADWVEVNLRHTWDQKATGFCKSASQCLVSNAYNEAWDNFPDRYWSETTNANKPKCINNGQYIGDNYCDNGAWSSRTRLVATQLLAVALNRSASNFSLYCDTYDNTLNKYAYQTDFGTVLSFIGKYCLMPGDRRTENCANNICVMRYTNNIAFGMSINTDISGAKSPLQALNMSNTQCNSAKNSDGDYDPCGNAVWYNHDTRSIIYAPAINPMPPLTSLTTAYFITPFVNLKNYVFNYVYKPDVAQYNYTFFNTTPQFKQVYIAKDDYDFAYTFRQANMTLSQIDYAGWYFSNINLPADTCSRIIKRYDGKANCETQPNPTEYYLAAHKTPPVTPAAAQPSIVDIWAETAGTLRVQP